MGKGIPADHWETCRQWRLPAGLWRDRQSVPQPPRRISRLWARGRRARRRSRARDLHAAALGQAGGAHVLHAVPQPRGAGQPRRLPDLRLPRQSPAASTTSSRRITGPAAAAWHRARDDVAEEGPGRQPDGGFASPIATTSTSSKACARSIMRVIDYCRQMGLDMIQGDHEDCARPARAQLHL